MLSVMLLGPVAGPPDSHPARRRSTQLLLLVMEQLLLLLVMEQLLLLLVAV
jgi:hypothetical protein